MTDIEKIEMTRYYSEPEDDLRHMVTKYCPIMGWEVPELDEEKARALIIKSLHQALAKVEGENRRLLRLELQGFTETKGGDQSASRAC
jgi:hypothetical protein